MEGWDNKKERKRRKSLEKDMGRGTEPRNFRKQAIVFLTLHKTMEEGCPSGSVVKNLPANVADKGSILGLGRSPGKGNGNLVQYSCLRNSMDRGAWAGYTPWVAKESDTT